MGWRNPHLGRQAIGLGAHVSDGAQVLTEALPRGRDGLKRAVDLVVGLILLAACLPVILVIAVGSALTLRAWPFFVQERIGRDGQTFRFLKIRTLPTATNPYADKYSLAELDIPRFTRLLRALHLDELPQLLLVVLGRMSLVGPRPEMPTLHAALPPGFAQARSRVRPGCTGLWQVGVDCDGLIGEAPEYDAYYVAHRSQRLDLWILWQTVRKVVSGGAGQVVLDEVPTWASRPRVDTAVDFIVVDLTDDGGASSPVAAALEAQPV